MTGDNDAAILEFRAAGATHGEPRMPCIGAPGSPAIRQALSRKIRQPNSRQTPTIGDVFSLRVIPLLGMVMLLTPACADAPARSAATMTTQRGAAHLPACTGADGEITEARWLPGNVPSGMRIETASSQRIRPGVIASTSKGITYQLAKVDSSKRLTAWVALTRNAGPLGPTSHKRDTPENRHSVRGHNGSIARWINPADTVVGQVIAQWTEDDVTWLAWGTAGISDMAIILGRLRITADSVTDPTGALRNVGQRWLGMPEEGWTTRITLTSATPGSPPSTEPLISVSIGSTPKLAAGLAQLPNAGPDSTLTEMNGRVFAADRWTAVTTTADGSDVHGEIELVAGAPPAADLRTVIASLHTVDPGDAELDGIRLSVDPVLDGDHYCRSES